MNKYNIPKQKTHEINTHNCILYYIINNGKDKYYSRYIGRYIYGIELEITNKRYV